MTAPRLARIEALAVALSAARPALGPARGREFPEAELAAFEAAHGVRLPDEHRALLLALGDAPLVPGVIGSRLRPLATHDQDPVWASFAGPLAADFGVVGPAAPPWDDEADDYARQDLLRGTICLGSGGCDLVRVLVVTGEARGTVWTFAPGLEESWQPTGLGLLDWCLHQLEQKLDEVRRVG